MHGRHATRLSSQSRTPWRPELVLSAGRGRCVGVVLERRRTPPGPDAVAGIGVAAAGACIPGTATTASPAPPSALVAPAVERDRRHGVEHRAAFSIREASARRR